MFGWFVKILENDACVASAHLSSYVNFNSKFIHNFIRTCRRECLRDLLAIFTTPFSTYCPCRNSIFVCMSGWGDGSQRITLSVCIAAHWLIFPPSCHYRCFPACIQRIHRIGIGIVGLSYKSSVIFYEFWRTNQMSD